MPKKMVIPFSIVLVAVFILVIFLYNTSLMVFTNNPVEQQAVPKIIAANAIVSASKNKLALVEKDTNSLNHQIKEALSTSSLRGTQIDRALVAIEKGGKIILNGALILYFDYFLSLQGEFSMEQIKEIVLMDMQANYPHIIAEQLYTVFERYVEYLADVSETIEGINPMEALTPNRTAFDIENETRARHFSTEEITQLFGEYDQLLKKPSRAISKQKQREIYRQIIAEHPEQLESVATEMFGLEAAQRLRALDNSRQEWEGRIREYTAEKRVIDASPNLDSFGKQQAISLLQERHFSEIEIRRVKALDRINEQIPQ